MAWDKIRPQSPKEIVAQQCRRRLQMPDFAVIWHHHVGGRQPLCPAGLRRHSTSDICFAHTPLHGPTQPGLVVGIHHDRRPTHRGLEQRHLDDCNTGKSLQIGLDSTEDHGMSDRFEHLELSRVVENDPGQRLAVYLAFEDDVRPSLGDRGQSFAGQNEVTHGVRVDGVNAPHRQ